MLDWLRRRRAAPLPVQDEATARTLVEAGLVSQQRGDAAAALTCYELALQAAPDHVPALHLAGVLDAAAGRLETALARFDRALALEPGNGACQFSRGEVLRPLGRLDEAVSAFERAVACEPEEPAWWNELGVTCEARGERAAALAHYCKAVDVAPSFLPALLNLGRVRLDQADHAGADEVFRRALELQPNAPMALFGLAAVAHARRDWPAAEAGYRRLLVAQPGHLEASVNLGLLLSETRRAGEALPVLARLVAEAPGLAPGWLALGVAQRALGQTGEAVAAHQRAAELDPDNGTIRLQWALSLEKDGDLAGAERQALEAVALRGDDAEAHYILANLLRARAQNTEAEAEYRQAIALRPAYAEAWVNYGDLLADTGRQADAASALEQALAADPHCVEAHLKLGIVFAHLGRHEESGTSLERALALDPALVEAHLALGMLKMSAGRPGEAEAHNRRALELRPGYAPALANLGVALQQQGRLAESAAASREALQTDPLDARTWSNLLFGFNYRDDLSAAEIFAEHRRFGDRFAPRRLPGHFGLAHRSPRRRLRVGYLSPDFRRHVVAGFFEPVLDHHDRRRFEVICYHSDQRQDAVTARLRQKTDLWRHIAGLDDDAAEALILGDRLDVLVDLAGHTAGNRLGVVARRVAPVQVTWLGYPNTTGLEAVDWRITDAVADLAPSAEALHTERLWRLPGTFLAYQPPADAPELGVPPCTLGRPVSFAAYNNFTKASDTVMALWARILAAVPEATLTVKTPAMGDARLREAAHARLVRAGCDPRRLRLAEGTTSYQQHLETFAHMDIALDTFPYHGTTTTCEALWMGLPVVTLAGDRHAARVGASLLSMVEAPDCVAQSGDDYVAAALRLAADPRALAVWRAGIRERMARSGLLDTAGLTRRLEAGYERMLAEACR